MPSRARRDIFACRKSDIVRFARSDIIFARTLAKRISLRSNTTRRKANITEKSNCEEQLLFS